MYTLTHGCVINAHMRVCVSRQELRLRTCHIAGLAEDTDPESIRQGRNLLSGELGSQAI